MNKLLHLTCISIILCACFTAQAQDNGNILAVESFTRDEADQAARITHERKDQNDKVCAIIKIETPLLLNDFTFDAGMTAIAHSEQQTGEIWLWLSPGTRRLTIGHRYLGTVRNYEFTEALKEATVYIMKLRSGNVRTVVEANVALQYMEVTCAMEGATIRIDDASPEPFADGSFQKALTYGRHRYTVEAPMYHPESGVVEITTQKSVINIELKPQFGRLTIHTQPEEGADVYIDDERRGQSPLSIERLRSGTHRIRVIKPQYRPAEQELTMTDNASETRTLTMQPNFAIVTLTGDGDIYVDDDKKAASRWNGRLTPGSHKVEVRKPSHRSSVAALEIRAGQRDTLVALVAPTPIYGTLDVRANTGATLFIDGTASGTTPLIVNNVLAGSHNIEFRASGYQSYRQTITVEEGKILPVSVQLERDASVTPSTTRQSRPATTPRPTSTEKKTSTKGNFLLMAGASVGTTISYTLMAGYMAEWGGYAKVKHNLASKEKTGSGGISDTYFNGGNAKTGRTSVSVGGIKSLGSTLFLYAGAGYGQRWVQWQSVAEQYVEMEDYTFSGIEPEAGLIVKLGSFSLSAGGSALIGKQTVIEANIAIGFNF
jgi:hypothetical protein